MSVYKRGETWWYKFWFANKFIRESAKTAGKTLAKEAEKKRRRELEEGYNGISTEDRSRRVMTVAEAGKRFLADYSLRHRPNSISYVSHALLHLERLLGDMMLVEVGESTILGYQNRRLTEKASPKTINEEVAVLLRLMGDAGDVIRARMKRAKTLKLKHEDYEGKALTLDEVKALYEAARVNEPEPGKKKDLRATRTPMILPAVAVALNTTLRRGEIQRLNWGRLDFLRNVLTVGKSKTPAGAGRTIPLNSELREILLGYRDWYQTAIAPASPAHYVFPYGKNRQWDPTRPITTLTTAWEGVRARAGVKARFHDLRHTAITNLCESGAPEAVIMAIAGHVSRRMLERYAHVRMEAKRRAVEALGKAGSYAIPAAASDNRAAVS